MATDAPAPSSKYQLLRPLGAGGMGAVYLARDTTLKREVALKFVAADLLTDHDARKRLVREAQAAAALDHPAICTIYEVELRPDGEACIVMQYVEGETLASRLARGPLAVREALTLTMELAEGLAAAHAHGVVHRDLKPQNVMVTPSGHAKLLDFGIATLSDAVTRAAADVRTTTLVQPIFAGTPAYMSPEQISQRPLDGRSDLFSLGCVLYECLTGRSPFLGGTALEVYGRVAHVHPPSPSTLRPELTHEHDELCRRLLAKEPADRFQSAEQLLGAFRVLLPDTSYAAASEESRRSRRWMLWISVVVAAAALGSFLVWRSSRPVSLPEPPPEAARWYARGTDAIREGAYHSAKLALNQALAIAPAFPQAYTRLAEALVELDEGEEARNALLQANRLAEPARLPEIDRLRNDAIQALVLRDPDAAAKSYTRLIDRQPRDAGAWLDLARVQELGGLRAETRKSIAAALTIDSQFPTAHLRLATLEAQEGRRDEALAAFAEAERLYRAASDLEGVTEVLLLRGAFLDSLGEVKDARAVLERALATSAATGNRFQTLRGELRLSSVTATEGRFEDSLKQAEHAVRAAREADMDTVAADGLIELGATLTAMQQLDPAAVQLTEALAIARRQRADGVALRATLNLASLRQAQGRSEDAVTLAESTLGEFEKRHDRRKRLSALAIIARSYEDLEKYDRAQVVTAQLLSAAREINDEPHLALAFESLATQATVYGKLPAALEYRRQVEDIHRRQSDQSSLAFDLINRAELLIRLGRGGDAEGLLNELEAGAARGIEAYVRRGRRVLLLRALNATINGQLGAAERYARAVTSGGSAIDSAARLATALLAYADKGHGAKVVEPPSTEVIGSLTARREVRFWQLAARLEADEASAALAGSRDALSQLPPNQSDELEWRLAAIGAAAAEHARDKAEAGRLRTQAIAALTRLRAEWKDQAAAYERRPDLVEIRRLAGM
jgi:tetratricopeptide (TPR) repeat protein/tRNA A-37 threonylcarbamoyl transferase component Bud32